MRCSATESLSARIRITPRVDENPARRSRPGVGRLAQDLESLLDRPVTTLCYPFAKQNREIKDLARKPGYKAAVIGRGGMNRVWTDPYACAGSNLTPRLRSASWEENCAGDSSRPDTTPG